MIAYLLKERKSQFDEDGENSTGVALTNEEVAICWQKENLIFRNYEKIVVLNVATEEELNLLMRSKKHEKK